MNSSLLCAPPQLMLRLCQTAELEATALSSRSFGVTPASIALSEHIRVAFSPRGTQEGLHNVLGHQQLSSSGATTLQVWNRIATELLDDATTNSTARFFVRHLHDPRLPRTVQIRVQSGATAEWVAHPMLLQSMHRCLTKVLGTHDYRFHVLGLDTVIATLGTVLESEFRLTLPEFSIDIDDSYIFLNLRYQQGFPLSQPS